MNKIIIAGGTGFLGKYIVSQFRKTGAEIIIISRNKGDVMWDNKAGVIAALNNADLVINLAGKSVDCRYNEKNKKEIIRSRVDTTQQIGQCILACEQPPKLWVNSSTATIYRHAQDRPMTEEDGEVGSGFSVDVATKWEQTFFDFQLSKTRQVALRMAIVLGDGGVMQPLKTLTKLGFGGKQGTGNQMFSWIHIEDIYQILLFIVANKEISGVINCSAPHPVTNKMLMQSLRKAMHINIGLPSPKWLLELGAVFIRTEAELILKSRWVLPSRLLKAGYRFRYAELNNALAEIVN